MLENWKKKQLEKILTKYEGKIKNKDDLLAGEDPSLLFYLLANKFDYLLTDNPNVITEESVKLRKKINFLIKKLGPSFLSAKQVFEDREKLLDPETDKVDCGIDLPESPVIWAPNHSFKDDTLASVLATDRHAYILFGSLPQFYNTFDGITAWLNGVAMTNRKIGSSRKASVEKSIQIIENGADLLMFSEGVWNKTPNQLLLDLWPGIYNIAKETGCPIVPVAHYIEDAEQSKEGNIIHTVVDDPFYVDNMTQDEALNLLRDRIGTWYYLMMEKYGKSTRKEVIGDYDSSVEAWEEHLKRRVRTADRYDEEIEFTADYRKKDIVRPETVFESIANIENITVDNVDHVLYAKQLVKTRKENDFQRRF